MWPKDDKLQALNALSFRDRWRASICLWRGDAPDEPRLAAAVVDLAESYRREGEGRAALARWAPAFLAAVFGCLAIWAAVDGDLWPLIANALLALGSIANFMLEPRRRPQNIARSLEASRRMLPSDWSLDSGVQVAEGEGAAAAGWYADPDSRAVERLWDGEDWTAWIRLRSDREGGVEADPAGWQPHPSKPGREMLWSGNDWTDRERDSVGAGDSWES